MPSPTVCSGLPAVQEPIEDAREMCKPGIETYVIIRENNYHVAKIVYRYLVER